MGESAELQESYRAKKASRMVCLRVGGTTSSNMLHVYRSHLAMLCPGLAGLRGLRPH